MDNFFPLALPVPIKARRQIKVQQPCVIWFTGLSGAGKSTIANLVGLRLIDAGHCTCVLDGDNIRTGLNRDLGFSDADRKENIRRVAEVARLMADAGLIVITALISPFRTDREMARKLLRDTKFIEAFVDAPLAVCEARDPKGLYKRARCGAITQFTGIDSPYEPPLNPELRLDTVANDAPKLAQSVMDRLRSERIVAISLPNTTIRLIKPNR